MEKDFIKNLKVGDEVVIDGGAFEGQRLAKVEKITPAGRIKVAGMLFNDDSHEAGPGYYRRLLREATPERKAEITRAYRIHKLNDFNFTSLTDEELVSVWNVVRPKMLKKVAQDANA